MEWFLAAFLLCIVVYLHRIYKQLIYMEARMLHMTEAQNLLHREVSGMELYLTKILRD